jgi:ACS family allantoate permease-like MFS transporter
MPTGIMQTVASYVCNGGVFLIAKYFPAKQLRTAYVMFGIIVGMISAVFLYVLPLNNYTGRLAALHCSYFYLGPCIVALGINTANTANTAGHTKKVTVDALVFIAYCVSNIIAPQFFKASQAPMYPLGMSAVLASYVLSMIIFPNPPSWKRDRRDLRVDCLYISLLD